MNIKNKLAFFVLAMAITSSSIVGMGNKKLDDLDAEELSELANYYVGNSDFDKAKKYYLLAVEKKHIDAMYDLATTYYYLKEYEPAEKYFLMAIENDHKDNSDIEGFGALDRRLALYDFAIYTLGVLYQNHRKDDLKAEKYFLLAIENYNYDAIYNLGNFYKNLERYDDAEKCYKMAFIKIGGINAMLSLGSFYKNMKKYSHAKKYYNMAVQQGSVQAKECLESLYD